MQMKMMVLAATAVCLMNAVAEKNAYMIVDVSGGMAESNWPVSYLDKAPEDGWSEEHKTDKIVFRKITAGSFLRRKTTESFPFVSTNKADAYAVKVPFDFYIGVFQVTQRQYEYMTGQRPSFHRKEDCHQRRPVENVSYDAIRGRRKGAMYPQTREVDESSVMGTLRQKTGLNGFDLPTEDMWEYACLAGACALYNNGTDEPSSMSALGRYLPSDAISMINRDAGLDCGTAEVGKGKANAWGLYDFHGNLYEWCLDQASYKDVARPIKPLELGPGRVMKGGSWLDLPELCSASIRYVRCSSFGDGGCGFRIAFFK